MPAIAFLCVLFVAVAGPAAAQEWDEYTSLQDGFRINFPGQPKVTTDHMDVAVELRPSGADPQR